MDDSTLRKIGLIGPDPTNDYEEEIEEALQDGEVPHFVIRKKNRHRIYRGDASDKSRRLKNLEDLFE